MNESQLRESSIDIKSRIPAPSGSADDVAEQPELEQGGGCHEEEWEEVAVEKDVDQDSEVEHYTSYYEQHYVTTADGQSLQVTED